MRSNLQPLASIARTGSRPAARAYGARRRCESTYCRRPPDVFDQVVRRAWRTASPWPRPYGCSATGSDSRRRIGQARARRFAGELGDFSSSFLAEHPARTIALVAELRGRERIAHRSRRSSSSPACAASCGLRLRPIVSSAGSGSRRVDCSLLDRLCVALRRRFALSRA